MLAPAADPVYLELEFNRRVLAFLGVTLGATTALFGLAPALRASSFSPGDALKATGARSWPPLGLLRPLVVAQVAFSLTVVFVAGLLVSSFVRLASVDTGFVSAGLTLVSVDSDELSDQEKQLPGSTQAVADQILDQVRQVDGVQSASMSGWALFGGSGLDQLRRPARPRVGLCRRVLLRGLTCLHADDGDPSGATVVTWVRPTSHPEKPATPTSVIVNETFAKRYLSEGGVIGKSFNRLGSGSMQPELVVGLVADAKYRDLRQPAPPTVYQPLQHGVERMALQVRSRFSPDALATRLRPVLARIHPSLEVLPRSCRRPRSSTTRC